MKRTCFAVLALSFFSLACGTETKKETAGVSAVRLSERDTEIRDLKALIAKLENTHSSDQITISALNDRLRAMEAEDARLAADTEEARLAKLRAQYAGKPGVDLTGLTQDTTVELNQGEYLAGMMIVPTLRVPENTWQGRITSKQKFNLPELSDLNLYITVDGRRATILDTNRFQFQDDGTIFTINE